MRNATALVIAAIGGGLWAAPADAADPPIRRLAPVPIETIASGWYLRGDFGLRWNSIGNAAVPAGFNSPSDNRLDSGLLVGVGAGFKADALRVDLTADYGSALDYRGNVAGTGTMSAKLQAFSSLLNFYYEPYSWNRLTPYIGVGVGVAYVSLSDYASTAVPPLAPVEATHKWNLAYALMAGASYAYSSHMLLDLGYRYLNLGTADTGSDATGRFVSLKDIAAHELRIGVRFMSADPPNLR